jgi:hypothetical protein
VTSPTRVLRLLGLFAAAASVGAGAAVAADPQPHVVTCVPSQLRLAATFYGAAAGQFIETLTFTNASHRSCAMSGWPRVEVEDAARQPVSMPVQRVVQGSPTARPYRSLTVRPRQAASFDIFGPDFDARSGRSCPSTSALRVTPPGARRSLPVDVKLPLCRLGYYVSPLIGGRSDHLAWTYVWHK